MKKIIAIGFCLAVFAVSASAQQADGSRTRKERSEQGFRKGNIDRGERAHVRGDAARTHIEGRRAGRDGRITPMEKRRMHRMRKHHRHTAFRFKHNQHRHHRRVI